MKTIWSLLAGPLTASFLLLATGAVSAAPVYPVKVGPTGRYLVDQNNVPFLMAGESPQAMIGNLTEEEAEEFFHNRQGHGFNTVWINLLCNSYTACATDGSTSDGIPPFTRPGDLSTPNEAYFARADRILQLAAQYGFLVILDPIETGGWLDVLRSNGGDKAREYGRFLGARYANFPNILWMHGNDFQTWSDPADDFLVQEVARGIQDSEAALPPNRRHLHTVELNFFVSGSLDDPSWTPLIQLNASYTYESTYRQVLKDYNRSPFPVFMVEAFYELETPGGTPAPENAALMRRQQYYSLLSGATGQLYGNRYTWQMQPDWQNQLDTPGATQMAYLMALFSPRRWYDLVPDQGHNLVTAGQGSFGDDSYVTAARTPDGTLAIAYIPFARTITVGMSQLSGSVSARWYDPSAGTFVNIPGSPFANSGARNFATPGNNADGDEDWVLVLEAANVTGAGLTSPVPGSTLPGAATSFSWSAAPGALQYFLSIGTTGPGSNNLYNQGQGTNESVTLSGLPVDGSTVYVRLSTQLSGVPDSVFNDYTFTAANQSKAELASPTPGSTLAGAAATFTWGAGTGAVQYLLSIGTTGSGSNNLYNQGQGTNQSVTVDGLPVDGGTVNVRLTTQFGGGTGPAFSDYTFTAATVDVRGTYTASVQIMQSSCTDPGNNVTMPLQGSATITGQAVGIFSGNATLIAPGTQTTVQLSGTVTTQGAVSGTFTYTTTVNGSFDNSGAGTLSGSLVGNTLNLSITGQIQNGETCQLAGTFTGVRASTTVGRHADLDGDGRSDVIWRHSDGRLYGWRMNGSSIQQAAQISSVGNADWKIVGIGDFDGDGKADMFWRQDGTGATYVWLMNGLVIGNAAPGLTIADPNWRLEGVGDFDGDGRADLLWRNAVTGQMYVWLMNGATIASAGSPLTVADPNWQIVGVGDFDGDGRADILWRHAVSGQTYVWLMNGLAIANAIQSLTIPDPNWKVAGVGDFDGDGKADVLWRNAVTGQVYIWLMNGATVAAAGSPLTVPDSNWKIVEVGDFDGDGKTDVLWWHAVTGQIYVWLMNGLTISTSGSPATVPDLGWTVQSPR
jgi:hypothetical protein